MSTKTSEEVEVEEGAPTIWGWQDDEGAWTSVATDGHDITRARFAEVLAPFGLELAGNLQRICNLIPGSGGGGVDDLTPITMVKVRAVS